MSDDPDFTICKKIGAHEHSASSAKPTAIKVINVMKEKSITSLQSSRSLIADASSKLDDLSRAELPSIKNLGRNIRNWRQQEESAPPILKARNGYGIPESFKLKKNGDKFLLVDSGSND